MQLSPSLLAYPWVQSGILAAAGALLLALRRWRSGGVVLVAACLWLYLCSTPAFAGWLQHHLAQKYPPRAAKLYPRVDAIVLVGGGPLPGHHGNWNANADPALATPLGFVFALYRAGKADTVVISAGAYTSGKLAAMLRAQGVPASAVHQAGDSHSTHEDALLVKPVLHHLGATRILLVTYPIHMPRSVATLQHEGIAAVAAPSFTRMLKPRARSGWLPSGSAQYLTRPCLHEYFGLAWYRLRGWTRSRA